MTAKAPKLSKRGRQWIQNLLGGDKTPAPVEALEPPPARETSLIEAAELVDMAVLATQLSELIESARSRIGGAMQAIDMSAGQAADYGRDLAKSADAIDVAKIPPDAVNALLALTHAMIERTAAAEQRLRSTNVELRVLQRDLSDAQRVADHDALTGLPNRRALEAALAKAVDTARATDAALSVAFCDIDHFKRLNDVHGHAVGDRVLRLVSDMLKDGAGEDAFVGRQGGEEFVMVFEGTETLAAAARVDTIRERLAARALRSRTNDEPIGSVTFSAGVAGLSGLESSEDLLLRADKALYRAKDRGRNQVMIDPGD